MASSKSKILSVMALPFLLVFLLVLGCADDSVKMTLKVSAPRNAFFLPKTTLRIGEAVQLTVSHKQEDGTKRDLTREDSGTRYYSTDPFTLAVEPDGRVTCVGTRDRPKESAIIGVKNGKLRGRISFDLLADGPGPTLDVVLEKTDLYEGEEASVTVYKTLPDGDRKDITAASSKTRYRIFDGFVEEHDMNLAITENGVISAPDSIGNLNRMSALVFVRNGEDVGWSRLKVLPERKRK